MYNDNSFAEGYAIGRDSNNGYNNNGFGGDWAWWIVILLIFGWGGNNGFGGFGGNGGNLTGYELGKLATTNDVASGFSTSEIMSDLNDILLGQAGIQQTLCQGFNGVNQTILTSTNQINQGLCTLGYNVQGGFNSLSHQLSDCCCKIERGIDSVNYNAAKNTCDIQNALASATRDIIDSQRAGTDRVLGFLTNQEMDRLRLENQNLKFQASQAAQNSFITANQEAQTAELIRRLGRDCPSPAYIVPNPNCCYNYNVTGVGYNNGGCGCGC